MPTGNRWLWPFLLLVTACTPSFESPDDLKAWVDDTGYPGLVSQENEGVVATFRYLPPEYLILNDLNIRDRLQESGQNTDSLLARSLAGYRQQTTFLMTLKYTDPARDIEYEPLQYGRNIYSEWLNRLLFGMKEFIELKPATGKPLPPRYVEMERNFGLLKSRNFYVIFPDSVNGQAMLELPSFSIVLKEFGLKTGKLVFSFPDGLPAYRAPFTKTIIHP